MNHHHHQNLDMESAPLDAPWIEDVVSPSDPPRDLPAGWHRLTTGLRNTQLYHVVPTDGGAIHWRPVMLLNGVILHRRCASEIHARWWLAAMDEPPPPPASLS